MEPRVREHVPSAAARARAAAAGVDLERLRSEAPLEFMMRCAEQVVVAPGLLAELAAGMLAVAFPDREVFRAAGTERVRVLAFPPLTRSELGRFDGLLAPLVDRPEWRARHAFFREVNDVRGTTRELGLPLEPRAYAGGEAVVGPFATEAQADTWGRERAAPPLVHDAFPMNGRWFCDVFRADEP